MDSFKPLQPELQGAVEAPFSSPEGINNASLEENGWRVLRGGSYRDSSTIIVLPTPSDYIHNKVESAIDGIMRPMNQKIVGPVRISEEKPIEKIAVTGCEVGDAYNVALRNVKNDPGLSTFKFLLTVEHDNLPPPNGLLKLIEVMYENAAKDENGRVKVDERGIPQFDFLGIGGLYWTKGIGTGMPMIYGNVSDPTSGFQPQVPQIDQLQECRGIAMGFTIWNLQALLKDPGLGENDKWFETKQSWDHQKGVEMGTQDLVFCQKALKLGYRFAVDNRVKVGHFDAASGIVY